MVERLKVGLVGAGVFASYHANKLSQHSRVIFSGIVDKDKKRASELADRHGVTAFSFADLLKVSDAVVIAAPASTHGPIAVQALNARVHCLIEKPIATTVEDADAIVALARSKNLFVQIGHQERMVMRAIGLGNVEEKPIGIEAVRHSPYSLRGTDTSVTMDLMTHDIDLCTMLMGREADRVKGEARSVRSNTPDMAYGVLKYGNATARLSASRVESESERWMKLTYSSGEVLIDFNAKSLKNTTRFALDENFADNPMAKDSLGAATDVFVKAILDGTPVLVGPKAGAIAVKSAVQIDKGEMQ